MISLEHLKLLAPKAARLEPGTGGTPEITFQEVADALAGLSNLARDYARYKYALDERYLPFIRHALILIGAEHQRQSKGPTNSLMYWSNLIGIALEFTVDGKAFSLRRKARRVGKRHWGRNDEENFMVIVDAIDRAEHELKAEFKEWNERLHGQP